MSILCPYLTALSNKEYIGQSLDIRLSKVCRDFVHPYLLNANSKSNVHTLSKLCPCPKFVQSKMCWTKVCPSFVHTLSRQNCHHRLKVKHLYFVQCLSMSNVCPNFVQAPLNSCPFFVLIHTICPNYANPEHHEKLQILGAIRCVFTRGDSMSHRSSSWLYATICRHCLTVMDTGTQEHFLLVN